MSLIFATQLTAVATAVLAAFAIVTAGYARKAFLKQAEEFELLRKQSERDISERRSAQAVRVFIGAPQGITNDMVMFARNASDFPVYDAQIRYLQGGGLSGAEELGTIMPDTQKDVRKRGRVNAVASAVLTFRDAGGNRWIRMPDGAVTEQSGASAHDSILALTEGRQHPLPSGHAVKATPPRPGHLAP